VDEVERGSDRAEDIARRLDRPMGVLGLVFLLVVLGQVLARDPAVALGFTVAGWVLWSVFVAEFVLRAIVARSQRRFWARNWWQVVFLVVPFLRFARALSLLRAARVGGVLSAAVRGSRSAGRLLSSRIGWLAVVTAVLVLAASQLLFVIGAYDSYANALHDAALATVTGEPLTAPGGPARVLEVALAVYSVVVFATLAGAFGAFFLAERDREREPLGPADGDQADRRDARGEGQARGVGGAPGTGDGDGERVGQ
jgi:voltage-gated potassium channel